MLLHKAGAKEGRPGPEPSWQNLIPAVVLAQNGPSCAGAPLAILSKSFIPKRGSNMNSANVKRSVVMHGHKTSISLEEDFWQALKLMAAAEGKPVARMLEHIADQRISPNLSSSVRVFVLRRLRTQE